MSDLSPEAALAHVTGALRHLGRSFALVGGLGVSVRAEVRFTRDVDLVVGVASDADAEGLVVALRGAGYQVIALVEHDDRKRLATVRLRSPVGITVDLLTASSGLEAEILSRAEEIDLEGVGPVPVARAEELLAMKVLSMDERRLQDRIDAVSLTECNPDLDLQAVRRNLSLIRERGYDRNQDLESKLEEILRARS
jgi:hypothetical protein